MTTEQEWRVEILDYLLGRRSVRAASGDLRGPVPGRLPTAPIRRWWTFEGKRYAGLEGPLGQNWPRILRMARRLDHTFNPRLRLSDQPYGIVDWPRTLARGSSQLAREYVVRSSGIGLTEDERAVLRGWAGWIRDEWRQFRPADALPNESEWAAFAGSAESCAGGIPVERLQRWAYTARRSRWGLLRDVVAESLRPVFEVEDIERLPLPEERDKLFEVVCLVRIARCLAPLPRQLCWLDKDATDNKLRLEWGANGVTCHYQQRLSPEDVLATSDYAGALAAAVRHFGVRIPAYIDLAFDFDVPRAGFDGIIVEAKSGEQQFDAAVAQLRTYRAARPRRPESRYLVWGIVERPTEGLPAPGSIRTFASVADAAEDLWVFSGADAIEQVLGELRLRWASPDDPDQAAEDGAEPDGRTVKGRSAVGGHVLAGQVTTVIRENQTRCSMPSCTGS